jgi:hypothetical protein
MVFYTVTTEYCRELSVYPVETKHHGAESGFIIMLNGTSVLSQMLADGG